MEKDYFLLLKILSTKKEFVFAFQTDDERKNVLKAFDEMQDGD